MQKNEQAKASDSAGLVCPFPITDMARLKMLRLFFEPLTVGLPWYLEPPVDSSQEAGDRPVRFIHPPENLKPEPDFIKRIAELKHWPAQNPAAAFDAYRIIREPFEKTGESGREIDQELRGRPSVTVPTDRNRSLQQHLMLHLAHAVAAREAEAAELLGPLGAKPSPLKHLLETEDAPGFLNDLSLSTPEAFFPPHLTEQVLAAWCGLFENYLAGHSVLVADRGSIWELLSGVWDSPGRADQAAEAAVVFPVPDFKEYSSASLIEFRKTCFQPPLWEAFQNALRAFGEKPGEAQAELTRLSREIRENLPRTLKTGDLRMRVKVLTPLPDAKHSGKRPWLPALFNKIFVWLIPDGTLGK